MEHLLLVVVVDVPEDPQFVPGELSLDLGRVTVARAGRAA